MDLLICTRDLETNKEIWHQRRQRDKEAFYRLTPLKNIFCMRSYDDLNVFEI